MCITEEPSGFRGLQRGREVSGSFRGFSVGSGGVLGVSKGLGCITCSLRGF